MKVRFIPILTGLVAAALYALNAWSEYASGETGAAIKWAIGGMCLTVGYGLMMLASNRRACQETRS
ncbi:MAG: hypothetical protein ACFE0P_01725 [Oceanicaulis sp.]